MINAAASALHGSDNDTPEEWWKTKWLLVGIAAAIYAGLFSLVLDWLGLIVVPVIAGWWVLMRGRKQAQATLRAMDTETYPPEPAAKWWLPAPRYVNVFKAYYYLFGLLPVISLYFFNYDTKWGQKLGWEKQWAKQGHVRGRPVEADEEGRLAPEDMPFWDCRRPTEIASDLQLDIVLIVLLVVAYV